jgi:hypothetical protein
MWPAVVRLEGRRRSSTAALGGAQGLVDREEHGVTNPGVASHDSCRTVAQHRSGTSRHAHPGAHRHRDPAAFCGPSSPATRWWQANLCGLRRRVPPRARTGLHHQRQCSARPRNDCPGRHELGASISAHQAGGDREHLGRARLCGGASAGPGLREWHHGSHALPGRHDRLAPGYEERPPPLMSRQDRSARRPPNERLELTARPASLRSAWRDRLACGTRNRAW